MDFLKPKNKLKKLNAILAALKRGESLQNRQLVTWLNQEEYENFESDWESQQQIS